MPYYQLTPSTFQDTIFISMNGLKKEIVSKYLTEIDSLLATKYHSGIQTIAIAVDNDAAGQKFAHEQSKYQFTNNMGKTVDFWESLPHKNISKDWNDVLKGYYAAKEINRQRRKQQTSNQSPQAQATTDSYQSETSSKTIDDEKEKGKTAPTPVPKDIVKTSMSDLIKDIHNYFVEPEKTLELLNFFEQFSQLFFSQQNTYSTSAQGCISGCEL